MEVVLTEEHVWHQMFVIARMGGLETIAQGVGLILLIRQNFCILLFSHDHIQMLMSVMLASVPTALTP